MLDQNEMRRSQALIDARAKIFWGDPPIEAVKHLMLHNVPYEEAVVLVTPMVEERNATLRGIGLRKTLIGAGMICVPIVVWLISVGVGFISWKLMGLGVLVGVVGLYLLINGIITLVAPKSESGDVADQ